MSENKNEAIELVMMDGIFREIIGEIKQGEKVNFERKGKSKVGDMKNFTEIKSIGILDLLGNIRYKKEIEVSANMDFLTLALDFLNRKKGVVISYI